MVWIIVVQNMAWLSNAKLHLLNPSPQHMNEFNLKIKSFERIFPTLMASLISNILISPCQVRPCPVWRRVSLGLLNTLLGLEAGVPPHVGPTVSAGDVEEGDTL